MQNMWISVALIDVARYQNEETVDVIRLHRVFFLEKNMRILL